MPFISSIRGNYSAVGRGQGIIPWRPVVATGGTTSDITVNGIQFRVHRFTSGTTNFVVSDSGTEGTVEALIVGGGGGGGFGHGGGGGGGAVLHRTNQPVSATTYSIVVGTGGSGNGTNSQNNSGGNSSAFGVTATGGGSGSNESGDDTSGRSGAGGNGANGGGGTYGGAAGGTGTSPTASGWTVYAGKAGSAGATNINTYSYQTGGGGGANQAGKSIVSTAFGTVASRGGSGGDGVWIPITGNNYYWGGGGGGVIFSVSAGNHYGGNGGVGGGAGGSPFGSSGTPIAGSAITGGAINNGANGSASNNGTGGAAGNNTGGGGGGGANENGLGGAGGSGFVAIRYPLQDPTGVYPPTPSTGLIVGIASGSMTGGSSWFNTGVPYYGVENTVACQLLAGEAVNQFQWRESTTTSNTAKWFLVMEQVSTYVYAIVAGWRFTGIAANAGGVNTRAASGADLTIGTLGSGNVFITPSGATFGTGNYYMAWVSADARPGSVGTGGIFVNQTSGGAIDYVTVDDATGYPDMLGVGYQIDFTEGRDTGSVLHMNFSYV
jgi:hypothetical protein